MKKSSFLVLGAGLLLLLASGCGLPGANAPAGETAGGRATGTQHPAVYEVRISDIGGIDSASPSAAWTGTEYGVAWDGGGLGETHIFFSRINKNGVKIGADIRISADAAVSAGCPSLVWTGSEYGVAWHDYRSGFHDIYFARFSAVGEKLGDGDTRISEADFAGSQSPSLVWTGSGYGVAWHDYRDPRAEIYFARIDASGSKIGAGDTRISENDTYNSEYPSLVWTGNGYGVAWEDGRDGPGEIYFARLDASGSKIGAGETRISGMDDDASSSPSVAWTGNGYGVAWRDDRAAGAPGSDIYFARIDSNGVKAGGSDTLLSPEDDDDSYRPSVVWTGSGYGVAWFDGCTSAHECLISRLDSNGVPGGGLKKITADDTYRSEEPSLVWTGTEYGAAYIDVRDGDQEIYFTRLDSTGKRKPRGGLVGTVSGALEGEYYIRNVSRGTYLTWDFATTSFALREYNFNWSPQAQRWKLLNNDTDQYLQLRNSAGSGPYLAGQYSGGTLSQTLVLSWSAPVGDEGLKSWKLSDGENDGQYYIVIKEGIDANPTYRLYGTSSSVVELKTSTSSPKFWEIIPAGE